MDVWLFGFILHKSFTREIPIFDSGRRPIIAKEKISPGVGDLIVRCLDLIPEDRPSWE